MKLLLVLGSDDNYAPISRHIKPLGFEIIHYRYVIKAMDNVDEINPQAIIISARDFPRHWKIFVHFVRAERTKENCPIVILKASGFLAEESSQAFFLGINGMVSEDLDNPTELGSLQSLLGRHLRVNEKRKHIRINVMPEHRLGFILARPLDKLIIPGELITISRSGISFMPIGLSLLNNIDTNTRLNECSLRSGDDILSPVCRLVRSGKIISMKFVSFPGNEKQILERYLEELSA